MSAETADEPGGSATTRGTVGVELGRRPLFYAVLGPFWAWLVVRWVYDWVVVPGTNVTSRETFFPTQPFVSAGEVLRETAAPAPLAGLLDWFAGGLDFIAFGIEALPQLAAGAWVTIVLTVVSILAGLVLAVPLSVARVYGNRVTRYPALAATELIRGTPLLAQLFVLYFGLGLTQYVRVIPGVGVGVLPDTAVMVALIGFTINSAAYQSEYIRSALLSVDSGQLTAGRAIGLSKVEAIRHVVLPQGLRFAIPGWSNELVYLIKYSSLASFITVRELFFRAEAIGNDTYLYVQIYTVAALFYIALVVSASAFMSYVEDRVAIPGLGTKGRR
ncbi:amino acid ABC transporter permease [Haloglomus halophilum]|uniref:amino acid ABC transporter permease n=1 Tax=Haloglomus halophilum TaxID=2962672 RepID=UPI0020C9AC79|nr:amino acid ABC transporter permease [Haloglomus halophilum]